MTIPPRDAVAPAAIGDIVDRARRLAATGRRSILGIAGAPGAGKSTVGEAILEALGDQAVLVPMDGFHLADAELARLGRRDRKGAPDTFDVAGYVALLTRLRTQSEGIVYAPTFDRAREEAIAGAVAVHADTPLVITEGNYLLLADMGWEAVAALLDAKWFVEVPDVERRARLVARRLSHGHPRDAAAAWVADVDERNAAVVAPTADHADLIIRPDDPAPQLTGSPDNHAREGA